MQRKTLYSNNNNLFPQVKETSTLRDIKEMKEIKEPKEIAVIR